MGAATRTDMTEPAHRLHTLPKSFHSEETDRPFVVCSDCHEPLAACEDGYVIQKVVRRGETIMELALCVACHDQLQASYSQESRDRIWNYYLDHGDIGGRLKKFFPLPVGDPDLWTNTCLTCGSARTSLDEYVIAGHVLDGLLVYGETPLMVCTTCLERIVELLSEQSRDTYDKWFDRVVPQAPEVIDDKPRTRVFL